MSAPSFRPSQVTLSTPPLGGCFNKCEAECAAALLVWACQQLGDEWQRLPLKALGKALDAALKANPPTEPIGRWSRNPFVRPDFARLASDGFVELSEIDGEKAYVLAPMFFERIAKWVVIAEAQS